MKGDSVLHVFCSFSLTICFVLLTIQRCILTFPRLAAVLHPPESCELP